MRKNGFTLVELLVVISIIGILMAVIIGSVGASRTKARDTRRAADMREIQIGLALYYDVHKQYPDSISTLAAEDQRFLPSIPTDPQTGADYEYMASNGNRDYCIGVTFEGSKPSELPDSSSCDSKASGSTANYKAEPQH